MRWFLSAGTRAVIETGDIEVVVERRSTVRPETGDRVELVCEGVVLHVSGDEVEVAELRIKGVQTIRRAE